MKPTSILILLTVVLSATRVSADATSNALKYLGIVKVLHSAYGTTTVTPAYDIQNYLRHNRGVYGSRVWDIYEHMRRDAIGVYHYWTRTLQSDGTYTTCRGVFPINELQRLNYRCVLLPGQFEYHELRDFSMVLWVAKVEKTGLFPPSEPYPGWLKSRATRIADTCAPAPYSVFDTYAGGALYESGRLTCKFLYLPHEYTFPMLCWIGHMWDH